MDGRYEIHEAVDDLLKGRTVRAPPTPDEGKKTFTLTVENKPVGGVMRALAQQLGKEVVFEVSAERRLTKEVSVRVKEASLGELLQAVVSPAGLKYELDGDTIRVFD